MADIYTFGWPVDQAGYEIKKGRNPIPVPLPEHPAYPKEVDFICPRGGPPHYYWPMAKENLGLWRRFAESCTSPEGALSFAHSCGLLDMHRDYLESVINMAAFLREIATAWDAGKREEAQTIYSVYVGPQLIRPVISAGEKKGKPELKFTPKTLAGALIIQAGEAITLNREFRRCRNESCTEWFRLGQGGATARREFCSPRCRVAWSRRQKLGDHARDELGA